MCSQKSEFGPILNHLNPSHISASSDIHLMLFSHICLGFLSYEVLLPKFCMNFSFHSERLTFLSTIYLSHSLIVKSKVQHHQYQRNQILSCTSFNHHSSSLPTSLRFILEEHWIQEVTGLWKNNNMEVIQNVHPHNNTLHQVEIEKNQTNHQILLKV